MKRMPFVRDDGGRSAAGFASDNVGDCVCRSVAIASGRPYQEIYDALARGNETQRRSKGTHPAHYGVRSASNGVYVQRKWFKEYMRGLGFVWVPTMRIGQGCKVHLRANELPTGRLVVCPQVRREDATDYIRHVEAFAKFLGQSPDTATQYCDTRKRKSELTGNTNFDLNRRASPRPYV